jgi:hypothetical protein
MSRRTQKRRRQRGGETNAELDEQLDELALIRIPSIDDGNCFFYTLESFFKLRKKDMGNYVKIRKLIVDHMKANKYSLLDFLTLNNLNNNANIDKYLDDELKELARSGAWDSQVGDFVSQMAPGALDLNIVVYDWDGESMNVYRNDVPTADDTIHMLRINNNHYDLLLPMGELQENTTNIMRNINSLRKTRTKAKTYRKK